MGKCLSRFLVCFVFQHFYLSIAVFLASSLAQQSSNGTDWTKAPNTYMFTGKDKKGSNVDGLYIPVKKAYEMWSKGGEFMVTDQGKYTPIPPGTASAGLYWEDVIGLIKSVSLEGVGENAKIKVLINKIKEGNAVVSYKVNDVIYWTWHVWVTDDPTIDGSTYRQGFEKDKNGNIFTDWKWMDRNLGATNAKLFGHDWERTKGLHYEWGRKDPFPASKIYGEAGHFFPGIGKKNNVPVKFRGNIQPPDETGTTHNTGYDTPNGNIRYSINNPIHYIIPPVYVYKAGETPVDYGEDYIVEKNIRLNWYPFSKTTWFSKTKFKNFDKNNYYNNVFWDLWGDTRGGKYSHLFTRDPIVAEESTRYSLKSPYDPCPHGWRVPSFYSTVDHDPRESPWGKKGTNGAVDIVPDAPSADFPGIKVYPAYGFDFSDVPGRDLGQIPVNGNYEYYPQPLTLKDGNTINRNSDKLFLGMSGGKKGPEALLQDDISDGALGTSTFFTASEIHLSGCRGLALVSDPANMWNHTDLGWYYIATTVYQGATHSSMGIRCIKDPNNVYMPTAFETEYIASPPPQYTLEQLKQWTKEPNCYIEYTNASLATASAAVKDRVIDIPLRKGYAMHKLYHSENNDFPTGGQVKSTSVVWTTDQTLIAKMEIIDGPIESAKLRVTLNENRFGNAVVAFHVGNSGWVAGNTINPDPILWSWHIWAPKSVVQDYATFTTESVAKNGIKPDASGQFVNPVYSYFGVPLNTTLMDRDLGSPIPFLDKHYVADSLQNFQYVPSAPYIESSLRAEAIRSSGGLHYQWGRKDPIPAFIYPGGFYEHSSGGTIRDNYRQYSVYKQTGLSNGNIVYGAAINEASYLANYSKEYASYSVSGGVTATDTRYQKIKKILKFSVANPFVHMYQRSTSTSIDWISDENGLSPERWGHGNEKSPYDPCPEGYRIPDVQLSVIDCQKDVGGGFHCFTEGNSPWYYNARFIKNNKSIYGIDPSDYNTLVNNEPYDVNKYVYPGGYVRSISLTPRPNVRYGFVLNRPEYNIGNYANNGIRGIDGGNQLIQKSGIWTSALALTVTGSEAIGMYFNTEVTQPNGKANDKLYCLTPTFAFRPQSAMSCRCAKIEYDRNGKEIARYDPLTK